MIQLIGKAIRKKFDNALTKRLTTQNMFSAPDTGHVMHEIVFGKRYMYRLRPLESDKEPPAVNAIFGRVDKGNLADYMNEALKAAETRHIDELPLLFSAFGKAQGDVVTPVVHDFTDVRYLLVTGMQGYGKTKGAMALLLSIMWANHTSALRLFVLDMKKEDMSDLAPLCTYANEKDQLKEVIKKLKDRIPYVQKLLQKSGFKNINDYNKHAAEHGKPFIRYYIALIEEYAALFELIPQAEAIIRHIAQIGRSSGVFMILSTQRADARAMDSGIKANMSGIFSFKQLDAVNAKVAGVPEAAEIKEVGEAYFRAGSSFKHLKVPFFSSQQASLAIRNLQRAGKVFKKVERA